MASSSSSSAIPVQNPAHTKGQASTQGNLFKNMHRKLTCYLLFQVLFFLTFATNWVKQHISEDTSFFVEGASSDNFSALNPYISPQDVLSSIFSSSSASYSSSSNKASHGENNDVIVVATIGGELAGLSQETGRVLWKRKPTQKHTSNNNNYEKDAKKHHQIFSPLLSTTTNQKSNSNFQLSAVPSIDGRVFHRDRETSIPDLVAKTPFVDKSGHFYVGSKESYAAAIHKRTGEVVKIISSNDFIAKNQRRQQKRETNFEDEVFDDTFMDDEEDYTTFRDVDDNDLFWIGRVDYSVSVYDLSSREVDVSFANSYILSVEEMIKESGRNTNTAAATKTTTSNSNFFTPNTRSSSSYDLDVNQEIDEKNRKISTVKINDNGSVDSFLQDKAIAVQTHLDHSYDENDEKVHDEDSERQLDTMNHIVLSNPNGNIGFHNTRSKRIEWVVTEVFSTAVAFALSSSSGTSFPVYILPDAPDQSISSSDYVKKQMQRQLNQFIDQFQTGDGTGNQVDTRSPTTIVGNFPNGELFALPLGPIVTTNKKKGWSLYPQSPTTKPPKGGIKDYPFGPGGPIFPPNNNNIHHWEDPNFGDGNSQPPWIIINGPPNGNKKSNWFRAFMKILTSWIPPAVALAFVVSFELGRRERLKAENINVTYLDLYSTLRRAEENITGEASGLLMKKSQSQNQISDNNGFSNVSTTTSSSLNNNNNETGGDKNNNNINTRTSETSSENADKEESDRAGAATSGGMIQVSDEILGFGGQGTIVYRGSLASRSVAVKRMLKTYHASAEREISLLISSDGHPNVVRYFLKEVRRDFVYLALELCDLSLHDLISSLTVIENEVSNGGAIGSDHTNTTETEGDSDSFDTKEEEEHRKKKKIRQRDFAMRNMLKQVAEGVKHLHDLRIVHRDLKPQNILLKRKNNLTQQNEKCDNVVEIFEQDEFIPKISDMGLGKQLAGQSSFGFSIAANASLARGIGSNSLGIGSDGNILVPASEKVLAGPGSVGWQAPEVMSLRPSTLKTKVSSSVTSEESSQTGDEISSPQSILLPSSAAPRTSRSVDIFSLGCIFHTALLFGRHPFGEWYEREANIMKNNIDISGLSSISAKAEDLVGRMLQRESRSRPTAAHVCAHPYFWSAGTQLSFLSEFSDRVEAEMLNISNAIAALSISSTMAMNNGETNNVSSKNNALPRIPVIDDWNLERNASKIVGLSWEKVLDPELISNTSKFRTYDPSSIRDCLRMIRNKYHHYDELPLNLKRKIGPTADGLMYYIDEKFPRLLIHCYNICRERMKEDDAFVKKYSIPPITTNTNLVSKQQQQLQQDAKKNKKTERTVPDQTCDEAGNSVSPSSSTPDDNICLNEQDLVVSNQNNAMMSSVVIWEGSDNAKLTKCRGWRRSNSFWESQPSSVFSKRNPNIVRCATDPKFRTRLCNHWDVSQGTFCPMRRKNKCVFAHSPVELRVKEGKRHRWGKLVDEKGNNSSPWHSGGEDTYGAAKSIENMRKEEGKWNTKNNNKGGSKGGGKSNKKKRQQQEKEAATVTAGS